MAAKEDNGRSRDGAEHEKLHPTGEASFSSGRDAAPDVTRGELAGVGQATPELAARWSRLDLNDEGVSGGVQESLTLGLSLYLSPSSRVMIDWSHSDVDNVDFELLVIRLQLEL